MLVFDAEVEIQSCQQAILISFNHEHSQISSNYLS